MKPPVSVVLVNDYPVVVAGLSALLRRYSHRVQVRDRVVGRTQENPADVTLLDFWESRPRGARAGDPRSAGATRVVIYSWHVPASGASPLVSDERFGGYLSKQSGPDELVAALERVKAGQPIGPTAPARSVAPSLVEGAWDWPGRPQGLSERESEVIALLSRGLNNDEIATVLFLSVNSIKRYIRSAYRKMGVTSRTRALLWAFEHGFTRQPGSG